MTNLILKPYEFRQLLICFNFNKTVKSKIARKAHEIYFKSLKKPLPIRAINKFSRIVFKKNLIK